MLWAAIFYAIVGSLLSYLVGRSLIPRNADRYAREADLRFALVRISEHVDGITLAAGEADENRRVEHAHRQRHARHAPARARAHQPHLGDGGLRLDHRHRADPHRGAAVLHRQDLVRRHDAGGRRVHPGTGVAALVRRQLRRHRGLARHAAARGELQGGAARHWNAPTTSAAASTTRRAPRARWRSRTSRSIRPWGARGSASSASSSAAGEHVLICGTPGEGKTPLFRALSGLWPWGSGRIVPAARRVVHVRAARHAVSAPRLAARSARVSAADGPLPGAQPTWTRSSARASGGHAKQPRRHGALGSRAQRRRADGAGARPRGAAGARVGGVRRHVLRDGGRHARSASSTLFTHELTQTTIVHIGRSTQAHLPLFTRVLHLTRRGRTPSKRSKRPETHAAPTAMKSARRARTLLPSLRVARVADARDCAADFGFRAAALTPRTPRYPADRMRDLAERILPVYQEDDPDRFLVDAARPADGRRRRLPPQPTTRVTLRERLQTGAKPLDDLVRRRVLVYDIYARARARSDGEPRVRGRLRALVPAKRCAASTTASPGRTRSRLEFAVPVQRAAARRLSACARRASAADLDHARGGARSSCKRGSRSTRIAASTALRRPLLAEDNEQALRRRRARDSRRAGRQPSRRRWFGRARQRRRRSADAARVHARPARAATHSRRPPTATPACSALARIAGDAAFRPRAPFESDGDDARAVIDWIARQSWSDGRVAMQGDGYGGFVAWSAARRSYRPALKAIATIATRWRPASTCRARTASSSTPPIAGSTTCSRYPNDAPARDDARWRSIDDEWYLSGRRYRDLPSLPGTRQRGVPQLAESPELRPVLAEVAAVRRRVRGHRHTRAHDHGLLLGGHDRRALLLHGAPSSTTQAPITRC